MDQWQAMRLSRARDHDICVTRVDCMDDAFCFSVQGLSDDYLVHINESVTYWPPTCNCEDNCWRPEILCKHIILCLSLMGADERDLIDCSWQPQQEELYELLSNAPGCCGCTFAHGVGESV